MGRDHSLDVRGAEPAASRCSLNSGARGALEREGGGKSASQV